MNRHTLTWIFGLGAVLALTTLCHGQRQLFIVDGEDIRIVRSVTDNHFEYLVEGGAVARQPFDEAQTILAPAAAFVPGYIRIENARLHEKAEAEAEAEETIRLEYTARLVANRAVRNVYLLVVVATDPEDVQVFGRPVGELERNLPRDVDFGIDLPADIGDVAIDAFFLSNGIEIRGGEDRFPRSSPYERYLRDVARGDPEDGPVRVMRSHQPATVRDSLDMPLSGKVTLQVRVDADGYVNEATALEYDDWRLVESVMRVIPLWQFKPRIQDGQPVPGTARLPFVF